MQRTLYVFVEGNDDETFFKHIIRPLLLQQYDDVKLILYRLLTRSRLEAILKTIQDAKDDYLFFADMDNNIDFQTKKEQIRSKVASNVDLDKIIIVKIEIESWYLAGINYSDAWELNIVFRTCTDDVNKEMFNDMMAERFSRISFMMEILKKFSIDTAKKQNTSFNYFYQKFLNA